MNKKSKFLSIGLVTISLIITGIVFAVHNLYPSASPNPVFYSLNDIYNLVASSTNPIIKSGPPDSPISTTTIPTTATTTHSISEIYAILANMVKQENVATGTVILGVAGDYGIPDPYYATTTTDSVASLEPTVSTNTKTDYSLEDIWNLIQTTGSIKSTPGSHTFPVSSGPNSSMHTTSEIYTYITDTLIPYLNSDKVMFSGNILGVTGNYTVEGWIRRNLREGLSYYWTMTNYSFISPLYRIFDYFYQSYSTNILEGRTYSYYVDDEEFIPPFNSTMIVQIDRNPVIPSIYIHSSSDYLYTAYPSGGNFDASNPLTVAAWIKRTDSSVAFGPIISGGEFRFAEWNSDNSKFLVLQIEESEGSWKKLELSNEISLRTWYHVVGVWDGSEITAYINGVEKTGTLGSPILANYPNYNGVRIGGMSSNSIRSWFLGGLGETAIWDRALSSTEVSQLYNGGSGRSLITP